jgi:hypothetical protein
MQPDDWFIRAIAQFRHIPAERLSERLRRLQARLDELEAYERAYLQGEDRAVERAASLLPLLEPDWNWATHDPAVVPIAEIMTTSAVLKAARYTRRQAATITRRAREARYPSYRPHRDPVNVSCAACDALVYAHTGTAYCWECTQQYDPLTRAAVEAARTAIDAHWRAGDAEAIIAYLQAQAGYHIEPDAARAIRTAVEAQDTHVHRILRLLAEWYAGRAAYAGLADPESLLRIRPIPTVLAGVYPLNLIVEHYANRAEALRAQREANRRRREVERTWLRLARVHTGLIFEPHPDILEVGLELECGADVARLPRSIERSFDGSVYVEPEFYADDDDSETDWQADLELRFRFPAREWPDWAARISALWKLAGIRQNRTCGNHVHVSLTERALAAIARPEFLRWFREWYLEDLGGEEKYEARLENRYCRWDCPSADEIRERMSVHGLRRLDSTRYRAVNWHAYHEHGTVEFRLLPHADDGAEYTWSVTWLLRTLSTYLQSYLTEGN